jgi:hypothetical protein
VQDCSLDMKKAGSDQTSGQSTRGMPSSDSRRLGAGGTADLRPHRPESHLRHCLDVTYDPQATCPRPSSVPSLIPVSTWSAARIRNPLFGISAPMLVAIARNRSCRETNGISPSTYKTFPCLGAFHCAGPIATDCRVTWAGQPTLRLSAESFPRLLTTSY